MDLGECSEIKLQAWNFAGSKEPLVCYKTN